MALLFDRDGQGFSDFIRNTAPAFNSLKIAPYTQLPWNYKEWQLLPYNW